MKRRDMLGMMGAIPLALSIPGRNSAWADGHVDPNTVDGLYNIHRKLHFSFDDRVVYWYLRAIRYGLVDSTFTPFWDMHVGFISVSEDEGDGFRMRMMSAIFYTDLESGKLLENFDNPFTGERIPVRQPGVLRASRLYDKAGIVSDPIERPGMDITRDDSIGPAWIIGDDVWCRGDTMMRMEPTSDDGRMFQVYDWSTFHGSISEVADPDVPSAACTQSFVDLLTWPDWLNMGDMPGNYVSRGFGRKSFSMDGMPPEWSAIMRDQYAKEYADPRGYIEGA